MSEVAIQANGLSKKYHIGSLKQAKMTLQERILTGASRPFRRIGGLLSGRAGAAADLDQEFWALDDVSFTINQGERVAIIGRNGAGKSTLLKILSRVTEPTKGTAMIRGRMGSLLEVGTGFHAELTGRENIFLNGSILGMREAEVRSKFDEIVAFSEVEQFIDTPVKHYSSGMKVRLAFSVAAHLEPEVLIVDEVLSVGDVRFRKKCMDQIHKVAERGATVLVVSHNAQTVVSICDRAIWLDEGRMVDDGDAAATVSKYLGQGMGLVAERVWDVESAPGGEIARLNAMRIVTDSGSITDCIDVREGFCVETELEVMKAGFGMLLKHDIFNGDGTHAFSSLDVKNPIWSGQDTWEPGTYKLRMRIPANFLQVDTYSIDAILWAWEPQQILQCHTRGPLCVHMIDQVDGTSARGRFVGHMNGVVRPLLEWDMEPDRRTASDGAAGGIATPIVRTL